MVSVIASSVSVAAAPLPCGSQLYRSIQWYIVLTLSALPREFRLSGAGDARKTEGRAPSPCSSKTVITQMVNSTGMLCCIEKFFFISILLKSFSCIACDKIKMTNRSFKGATFSVDKSDVANQFVGHKNCG